MRVAFDASVLVFLFDEDAKAPIDVETGLPVTHCKERVSYLIAELQKAKARIIVPSPALAEILVYAGSAGPDWLRLLSTSKHFRISAFDELAAVEFAALERDRIAQRPGSNGATKRKIKFDEQIVAIATIEQVDMILSDDDHIRKLVGSKIQVRGVGDLDLPPQAAQISMQFQPLIDSTDG